MARTYATWNPSDKAARITLSNGNLTTAMDTQGGTFPSGMARSTISKTSGKWYWETTVQAGTVAATAEVGTDNGTGTLTTGVGQAGQANGYGWYNAGGFFHNSNTPTGTQTTYTVGDICGVAVDMNSLTLQFYKNGVATGAQITGLPATMFAGIGTAGDVFNATTNFGATALSAVPSGFNAGLYNDSTVPTLTLLGVGI